MSKRKDARDLSRLMQEAIDFFQSKNYESAHSVATQVLSQDSRNAKAAMVAACVLAEWQRTDEAAEMLGRAHRWSPQDPEILFNLAQLMARAGRYEQAVRHFEQQLALDAGNGWAWNEYACVLWHLQRRVESEQAFVRAARAARPCGRALNNLTYFQVQRGELSQALQTLERLREEGGGDEAFLAFNHAFVLIQQGCFVAALSELCDLEHRFEKTPAVLPQDMQAIVLSRIGACLMDLGHLDEAAKYYERSADRGLEDRDVLANFALFLHRTGRQKQAWEAAQKALALAPDDAVALVVCATLARGEGWLEVAIGYYRRAMEVQPDNRCHQYYASTTFLAAGQLDMGWSLYAQRWALPDMRLRQSNLPWPRWQGESGRLLIVNEQGLGDEVLFASTFNTLQAHQGEIVCLCNPKLLTIFARSFPHITFVPDTVPPHPLALSKYDYQVSMGDLMALLRPTIESFPQAQTAYLVPDPVRVEQWRARLASLPGMLKVGLAWRSGLRGFARDVHYPGFKAMSALAGLPQLDLVNVQYGATAEELDGFVDMHGVPLYDAPAVDHYNDLDASLAMIVACDVVVAPCIATAFLAAAAGGPTIQVQHGNFDPWMLGQPVHPWMPMLTSIGKSPDEPWEMVFEKVALVVGGLLLERAAQMQEKL